MKNEDEDSTDKLLRFAYKGFACVAVLASFALLTYFLTFGPTLSTKQDAWGQFGDFFGGLINPIVGVVTIFLVFVSISIQRRELRLSLLELKESNLSLVRQNRTMALQSFEQTFFAWLASYRELVSSATATDYKGSGFANDTVVVTVTGRDALLKVWTMYLNREKIAGLAMKLMQPQYDVLMGGGKLNDESASQLQSAIFDAWDKAYKRNEHHIDSMFRTLYRLIKWIDEQDETLIEKEKKWQYVAIIRSQISRIEMVYLFYNGFTQRGKNFNQYINRYALFDNLEDNNDLGLTFLKGVASVPYADSAFSSEVKRSAEVKRL